MPCQLLDIMLKFHLDINRIKVSFQQIRQHSKFLSLTMMKIIYQSYIFTMLEI